jgi:hypothetical protein
MPRLALLLALAAALVPAAIDDSAIYFTSPPADTLTADTTFGFGFYAMNAAEQNTPDKWIYKIEVYLPSADYEVDETSVTAPGVLHGNDPDYPTDEWLWNYNDDPDGPSIVWMNTSPVTSEQIGDLRAGESLTFTFRATTDAVPTDGFHWALTSAGGDFVTGVSYIGLAPDDDDDNNNDDDNNDNNDADDDGDNDEDSGCGG